LILIKIEFMIKNIYALIIFI